MGRARDLTGETFGRLTVLSRAPNSYRRESRWHCRCICGRQKIIGKQALIDGLTKSCGCGLRDALARRHGHESFKPLQRWQTFGRLTILGLVEEVRVLRNTQHEVYACACECGNFTVVQKAALRRGATKSCGCLKRETMLMKIERQRGPFYDISRTPDENRRARLNSWQKKRRDSNSIYKLRSLLSAAMRRGLRSANAAKAQSTLDMLDYTVSDLKRHIERQWLPGMSWGNLGRGVGKWHIDHITPISIASTVEDVIRLNQLWNLRPLWSHINVAKSNKLELLI